jgi:hypothetical protein
MNAIICITDEHKLREAIINFEKERANLFKKYQPDIEETKSEESKGQQKKEVDQLLAELETKN